MAADAPISSVNWPDEFPVLETERLLLRQVSTNDTGDLFRCYSDPEVMKYLATPLENEDAIGGILEDYKDGFSEGYNLIWALDIKETGVFAGTAGFEEFSFLDGKADIGFSMLPSHQGKGYMEEVLLEIINYGFQILRINRIQTTVVPENIPSVKLLGKLGFHREGCMKQSVFFNNSYHDELIMALLSNTEE
ncbi:MAG: GNAT family N-acetyltransferase [Candidatus Sabulitectum sp.]|nr:GNAT family N-acetyltransferase [Candidatus Sabulitectum sp.]